ncbi:8210_t:CDS:2 [Ambispora gerdemannii]|uniref:8210_t:CDS:1 n=1 Tax=Ambispora gerdemannii TaxID=144530 RepID=A0A9N9HC74_9GLOM|nr:8210_t:CDS:2 [Ambispora gerdemannii]
MTIIIDFPNEIIILVLQYVLYGTTYKYFTKLRYTCNLWNLLIPDIVSNDLQARFKSDLAFKTACDIQSSEQCTEFMTSPQFTHENNNFFTFIFPKNYSLLSSKILNNNNNGIDGTLQTTTVMKTHFTPICSCRITISKSNADSVLPIGWQTIELIPIFIKLRVKKGLWIAYINTVNEQQEMSVEIRHCKFSKQILLSLVDVIDQLYGAVGMLGVNGDEE